MSDNIKQETEPKERILDTAIRLFAQKGYSGTGVREIAREADVNVAMINYYFGSKGNILKCIINDFFDAYKVVLDEVMGEDKPLDALVPHILGKIIGLFRENPDRMRVVFTEVPFDLPEIADVKAQNLGRMLPAVFGKIIPELEKLGVTEFRPEIVGPSLIGGVLFHFLMKPVLGKVLDVKFDDAFYEEYPEYLSQVFLYGVTSLGTLPQKKDESHV